jgi:hypothetical protein
MLVLFLHGGACGTRRASRRARIAYEAGSHRQRSYRAHGEQERDLGERWGCVPMRAGGGVFGLIMVTVSVLGIARGPTMARYLDRNA